MLLFFDEAELEPTFLDDTVASDVPNVGSDDDFFEPEGEQVIDERFAGLGHIALVPFRSR